MLISCGIVLCLLKLVNMVNHSTIETSSHSVLCEVRIPTEIYNHESCARDIDIIYIFLGSKTLVVPHEMLQGSDASSWQIMGGGGQTIKQNNQQQFPLDRCICLPQIFTWVPINKCSCYAHDCDID